MGTVLPPIRQATGSLCSRWAGSLLGYALVLIVALLSAEYVSGSTPIPLLDWHNLAAYWPYDLALLSLGALVPLSGRSHYLFGVLLGLGTETLLTKVAWGHGDQFQAIGPIVGGFALWELGWLVLTYHALFSITIPFMLCGHYFGLPTARRVPDWPRRAMLVALPLTTGVEAAFGSQPPELVSLAFAVNAALLTLLIAVWRRWGKKPRWKRRKLGWAILLGWAAAFAALLLGDGYRPPLALLLVTLVCIGLAAILVWLSVELDRRTQPPATGVRPSFTWYGYAAFLASWIGVEGISYGGLLLLGQARFFVILALTTIAGVGGVIGFGWCVMQVVWHTVAQRRRPRWRAV